MEHIITTCTTNLILLLIILCGDVLSLNLLKDFDFRLMENTLGCENTYKNEYRMISTLKMKKMYLNQQIIVLDSFKLNLTGIYSEDKNAETS